MIEVAESHRLGPEPVPGTPRLLLEVPHGATARGELDAFLGQLGGPLPERLEDFFHVNTDEGAPELARAVGRRLAAAGCAVRILRCRIPRTLIDVNRVVAGEVATGMTAGLPPYVRSAGDRRTLLELHRRYLDLAGSAYAETCGAGGLAVAVHTYAPRSIEVEVGADVVAALRRAYRPAVLGGWPLRPPVDLITATADGEVLAPRDVAGRLRVAFAPLGLEVTENATYRLHSATTGCRHSRAWPGQVLTVEVRRDLLGSPWRPFVESRIGPRKVGRIARPLAAALLAAAVGLPVG
jgi:hypothetical protein